MSDVWRFTSNFYVSVATSSNLIMAYIIINKYVIGNFFNVNPVDFTGISKYDFMITLLLFAVVPLMCLNYFLIYTERSIVRLVKKYDSAFNKQYFFVYFTMSFIWPVIWILTQVKFKW